jgi:hypothetical protein
MATVNAVDVLDFEQAIGKRAVYEALEFHPQGDGTVEVVNRSHEDPDAHTYTVHVGSGLPSDCTCPHWEYRREPCKHMVGVALRQGIIDVEARADR